MNVRQLEKEVDDATRRAANFLLVSTAIAIMALTFQVPYLTGICIVLFWVIGILGCYSVWGQMTRPDEMAEILVDAWLSPKFSKEYDNRFGSTVFQVTAITSLLLWFLFFIRGHVWLAGFLFITSVLHETSKYRIRKLVQKRVDEKEAEAFIKRTEEILKGKGV